MQKENHPVPSGGRYNFASHLQAWGPGVRPPVPLAEARAYCERFAREHEENFPVLSFAVPARLRPHFAAVYAYCRWADDLGDEIPHQDQSLELLDWWEEELRKVYDGLPTHPVMIALRPTVEEFHIPAEPFLHLLAAFRQDQTVKRYASMDELLGYCQWSANPVGRLVLYLLSSATPDNIPLSDAICTGLQLANFWQDVRVDYLDKGRIYIPADRLQKHRLTEQSMAEPTDPSTWKELLRELVDEADEWLVEGLPLARRLRGRFSIMTAMFAEGGRGILRRIRKENYNVLSARPRLNRWDRAGVVGRAIAYTAGF
ncbi:squalene synthase HpnC [bacterium]|jgi:squalene synthase HpnC|nr:squalene synthase HpnC [bacterium]